MNLEGWSSALDIAAQQLVDAQLCAIIHSYATIKVGASIKLGAVLCKHQVKWGGI